MSKRNIKKLAGKYQSNLIGKLWANINTGEYGTVALPDDSQCLTIKSDTNVMLEYDDEKSGARTNTRNTYTAIRMKGKNKVAISTHLHVSASNDVESSLGQFLEVALGKKEVIASTRGASALIQDPFALKAGLIMTTAGALIGIKGNLATLALINGGATGSVSLTKSVSDFTLTYFNNSTITAVVAALDADADLVAVVDGTGTPTTDLFIDLLAVRNLASNATTYFSGGSDKGFMYSNDVAPRKDMTLVYNKEKTGDVVTGFILDKLSIDIADKLPAVKIEGIARKSVKQGIAVLTTAASSVTKLRVGAEYKQFSYDSSVDSFIDVLAVDGITYIARANKVVGSGVDGTGPYVEVLTAVTAPINSYVVFHEPENHNPEFRPLNGMSGSATIDGITFAELRSVKMEYSNNHQVFDNFALEDSIKGFDPSKDLSCKISVEVLARQEHLPLIKKLQQKDVQTVPVTITVGKDVGSKVVIFVRLAHVKTPNLADKADEVQSVTFECEVVIAPETVDLASVVIVTC